MTLFNNEQKKNYYEVLGLAKNAEAAEIKRAYFGLVRKYQPDRFPEEFKEIRAAYETLSSQEKRAEYDAIGDLPASVAPLFHEAQRFDRFGRHGKAAELYRGILKSHPELDNVREEYAWSLRNDDKTGKAVEVWEELCRRQPGNSHYARELTGTYLDRGWIKKALAEARRAVSLDRTSIDNWSSLIACAVMNINKTQEAWDEAQALSLEALKAVKNIKTGEWKKIHLYAYAFITSGLKKKDIARGHLRELVRLTREGGRESREEGRQALEEILRFVPVEGLAFFYSELKELADLLPDMHNKQFRLKLSDIRLYFDAENLVKKNFHEIFRDLFRILLSDIVEDEEALEVMAIECYLLDNRDIFFPQMRRLKAEFPDLYALYDSFFNEALRSRNPEKMLFQRSKKLAKLNRKYGFHDIHDKEDIPEQQPIRRDEPKVGRNDPCPCGSGKKYKRCCGA